MLQKLAFLKPPLVWLWKNRKSFLASLFFLTLLCKWIFGRVSTSQLTELVQALASALNPVTLF